MNFTELSEQLAWAQTKRQEAIIILILTRHYGSIDESRAAQVFAKLEADGLVLEKRIPPYPANPEIVLYRGPEMKRDERLDESRVIDREEILPLFPRTELAIPVVTV